MTGRRTRARLLALMVLCACRDETPSPCAAAPSHQRHACGHAREGPHGLLDGRLRPVSLVSEPHTHYTVALAPEDGGTFSGQVQFQAPRAGCWAFFVAQVERLLAERTCRAHRGFHASAAVTACQELDRVFTLPMAGGERVLLAIRASQARAGLLVERVASLSENGEAEAPTRDCSGEPLAVDAGPGAVTPDDALAQSSLDGPGGSDASSVACRASGPCSRDDECCEYCHDGDHCH